MAIFVYELPVFFFKKIHSFIGPDWIDKVMDWHQCTYDQSWSYTVISKTMEETREAVSFTQRKVPKSMNIKNTFLFLTIKIRRRVLGKN